MLKLSVIIVNYNVKFFVEQCLLSVQKAIKNIDTEVWVVDNHSADGSVEMIKSKFPWVKLIENKENVGFSMANNQAIKRSSAEYILLLNPDTVVQEATFEKCLEYLNKHPAVGGLGVKMIDGKGRFLPESKRGLPTPEVAFYKMIGLSKLFPKSRKFGKYHLGYIRENETAFVDVLAGAYMLMPKRVLEKTGLLDETFFMYGEDIDLSYRITLAGFKNVYFPETSIIHYKGESTKKMSVNYVFVFYRAMVIFAKKHYTGRNAKLFSALINSSIYLRAFIALIRRFFVKTWLFWLDAVTFLVSLIFIKNYWEKNIVNFEGHFPEIFAQTHFPAYLLIWTAALGIFGGYKKPYTINKTAVGILAGTLVIAAIYGFLPENFRYSRGIILAGTIFSLTWAIFNRMFSNYFSGEGFTLSENRNLKTTIVGNKSERERVLDLLKQNKRNTDFLGFISIENEIDDFILGTLDRLDDLCQLYSIDEVIFCSKDVKSSIIIDWMSKIGTSKVHFKIVPEDSLFIIGSNDKNLSGELYAEEIRFDLSNEQVLRTKRIIDIILSIGLMVFGIALSWKKGFSKYYRQCWTVLIGKYSWVGYDKRVDNQRLPKIREGIYSIASKHKINNLNPEYVERLNYFYAKIYHWTDDVKIIISNIFNDSGALANG
ncbi:MAG: glycosyltransferase [Flavobacteriales bacterium]|nr:glycosyltransferase [Flavobacteriales bacterium]